MTDTDTSPTAEKAADRLPRHTTPTWEVELLISGVAVFAMLQLPGWLDDRIFALLPRFDHDWAGALTAMYIYLKSAAVVLAATFLLHLTLRANWIALVGMHSVFPGGVRWERLRMGPVQRACERQRQGSPADAIERADNRATVVFAVGVMLGSALVLISIIAELSFGVVAAIHVVAGGHLDFIQVFAAVSVLTILPLLAARLHDRKVAERLPETSWQRRTLTRIFNAYLRVGISQYPPVWTLLSSHAGERRTTLIVVTLLLPLLGMTALSVLMLNSPNALGNYALFPHMANDSRALNAAYYDDRRDAAHSKAVPYIQSAVVADPYLQLVVPYQPGHDADALRRSCAPILALHDASARAEGTLDCLGKLHAVTLDGKPLPDPHYQTGSDARTRRPALIAMIDVRPLATGRHELRVMRAPALPGNADKLDTITQYVIPFWR